RPDVIRSIHAAYVDAGADVVSTNTFGCAPYVLAEYGLAERAHELCVAAARIAREAAGDRFVVGAMGPSTRSISVTRNVTSITSCTRTRCRRPACSRAAWTRCCSRRHRTR